MINKHMSLLIVSMLLTSAAQAQEQTDTSTWKYVNDNASSSVISYKKSNYNKDTGKPKNSFLTNISGSLDTTMLGQFYGLVPNEIEIDTSLLGSTFNNISVKEDYVGTVSVKVAFLDENAGYSNALGYFIYDTSNPPSSISNIDSNIDHVVIFPNASKDDGGALTQGDQVDLYIELTAGQSIGFFIASDNWVAGENGQQKIDLLYDQPFYTLPALNPSSSEGRQYHVLFDGNDPDLTVSAGSSGAFIYGFEDRPLTGTGAGDRDYNDLSFHVEVTPLSAIANRGTAKKLSKVGDTTNSKQGKLAFEDNWPMQGDYDFNDVVVSYDLTKVTTEKENGAGDTVNIIRSLSASYEIDAIGAIFRNGFALSLPGISLDNIDTLNLTKLNDSDNIVASYDYDAANGGFSANEVGLGLVTYQYPLALESDNARLVITLTENFFEELSGYSNSVSDPSDLSDSLVCMFQTTDDSDLSCPSGTTANKLTLNIVFKQDAASEVNWVDADTTLTQVNYDHFIFASEKGDPTDENTPVYKFSRDNSDDSWFTKWTKGFGLFGQVNGPGRSLEVHLANYTGTEWFEQDGSFTDPSLFDEPVEGYVISADVLSPFTVKDQNLPWVLDLPVIWEHPLENKDISQAYPEFIDWLENPESNSDWYDNGTPLFIYSPQPQ